MNETLRTFIAIDLDDSVKNAISSIEQDLKKADADVKWVEPKSIHLTIKFLGPIPVGKIEIIKTCVRGTAERFSAFSLDIASLGTFPSAEKPHIIWLGIKTGRDNVGQIALALEDTLEKIGFAKENRDFEAHITIGRTRSGKNQATLLKKIKEYKPRAEIIQRVEALTLFQSTLTAKGPVYETIERFAFRKDYFPRF